MSDAMVSTIDRDHSDAIPFKTTSGSFLAE
jgi:hypothetical protein